MPESIFSREVGDVFPTVRVDRSFGTELDFFDIDIATITNHLRDHGMSDEAISALTITFRTQEASELKQMDKTRSINLGEYLKDDHEVQVYKPEDMTSSEVAYEGKDKETMSIFFDSSQILENNFTNTLVHELEHALLVDNEDVKAQNIQYIADALDGSVMTKKQKLVGSSIAILAGSGLIGAGHLTDTPEITLVGDLTMPAFIVGVAVFGVYKYRKFKKKIQGYDNYFNMPEEIHARNVADAYEGTLIKVVPKTVEYTDGGHVAPIAKLLSQSRDPNLIIEMLRSELL